MSDYLFDIDDLIATRWRLMHQARREGWPTTAAHHAWILRCLLPLRRLRKNRGGA